MRQRVHVMTGLSVQIPKNLMNCRVGTAKRHATDKITPGFRACKRNGSSSFNDACLVKFMVAEGTDSLLQFLELSTYFSL